MNTKKPIKGVHLMSAAANSRISELSLRKRMTWTAIVEALLDLQIDELVQIINRTERRRKQETR
jgi:hypothetical protein